MDNNNYQQPPMQYPNQQPNQQPANGLGIASLVLGIIALVLSCFIYVSIPCGIVGLILGGVAKSKGNKSGVSTAGLVLCIISVAITIIITVAFAAAVTDLIGSGAY